MLHVYLFQWIWSFSTFNYKLPKWCRALAPLHTLRQRDTYKVIDNRPESTVFVEGAETQALFNYLLNCRSCIAITGLQAGLPPTILAPVAFKGATLSPLKVSNRLNTHSFSVLFTGSCLFSSLLYITCYHSNQGHQCYFVENHLGMNKELNSAEMQTLQVPTILSEFQPFWCNTHMVYAL